ncbi:MAG: hypothetical protein CME61_04960 [Halobacteriovoraceae bacterium]|nr:hypothetical protein [Halobacteriovoraceae bacterium]
MKFLILICILILLFSCGDDGFKKYEKLEQFRVLGIIADTPEVNDSQAVVTLTPVVSDISSQGREITISINACVDPGVSRGAEVTCEEGTLTQEVIYNSGNAVDLNATLGASLFTGAMPNVSITLPSDILTGKTIFEQYNGVDYLVILDFKSGGESLIKSLKRIKVSSRPVKNSNPVLGTMSNLSLSSSVQDLKVTNSSSKETFDFFSLSGNLEQKDEVMYLTWFTSSGEINNSQVYVDEPTKVTFASNLPAEAVVVVLLRDGRGGLDFNVVYLN